MADENGGAVIIYGRGAELGSFVPFINTLKKKRLNKEFGERIVVKQIERRDAFFDFLKSPGTDFPWQELHIYSHAFGAGLALGYRDDSLRGARVRLLQKAHNERRQVSYDEVMNTERGIIFTDNLVSGRGSAARDDIRKHFTSDAFVKIWGCNSAIEGWVFGSGDEIHYWGALNTRHTPKPSIAQAFADYLDRPVYGATRGTDIQVRHEGKWITSEQYKTIHGRWPSGALTQRLHPIHGEFREFTSNMP